MPSVRYLESETVGKGIANGRLKRVEDTIAAQMLQSVATMTTAPLRPAIAAMPQHDHVSSSGAPLHQLFSQLQLEKEDFCREKLS